MRDFVVALLSVAVISLSVIVWIEEETIEGQEKELQALSTNLGAVTQTSAIELQAKCAQQAANYYRIGGWQENQNASYLDHYNSTLGKCFIFIKYFVMTGPDQLVLQEALYDAFELKNFGVYQAYYDHAKSPVLERCAIRQQDGKQASCKTQAQFESDAAYFLGQGV
jgi:hypothetical protein